MRTRSSGPENRDRSGEAGIRTLDTASGIPVFETGAFNHSATSPGAIECSCEYTAIGVEIQFPFLLDNLDAMSDILPSVSSRPGVFTPADFLPVLSLPFPIAVSIVS
jgi:hypothetical protein